MSDQLQDLSDRYGDVLAALARIGDVTQGVVVSVSPLRVRLVNDADPLPYTPLTAVGNLVVGERVWCSVKTGTVTVVAVFGRETVFGHAGYEGSSFPGGGVIPITAAQETHGILFDAPVYGFRIPKAGVYEISAQFRHVGGTLANCAVMEGSTTLVPVRAVPHATAYTTQHVSVKKTMTTNTLIRLYATSGVEGATGGYAGTYLEITKVG